MTDETPIRCLHDDSGTIKRLPPGDHRPDPFAADVSLIFKRRRARKWLATLSRKSSNVVPIK